MLDVLLNLILWGKILKIDYIKNWHQPTQYSVIRERVHACTCSFILFLVKSRHGTHILGK